jgi:hypothetical protein
MRNCDCKGQKERRYCRRGRLTSDLSAGNRRHVLPIPVQYGCSDFCLISSETREKEKMGQLTISKNYKNLAKTGIEFGYLILEYSHSENRDLLIQFPERSL